MAGSDSTFFFGHATEAKGTLDSYDTHRLCCAPGEAYPFHIVADISNSQAYIPKG